MVSLYGILNVGARGVNAAQAGLDITGQNIANANTEGYSRQRVIQQASNPLVLPNGAFGQGVEIVNVERLRDLFLDGQIRTSQSDAAFYREMESLFTQVESILNDPLTSISDTTDSLDNGGINNLLSRFFRSMQDLSTSPDVPEVRSAAVESADTLAQTFSTVALQLDTFRNDLNNQVAGYVEEINRLGREIASLNQQISVIEGGSGANANDLQDQRDRLLADLAEIVPIDTESGANGVIDVNIAAQRIVDSTVHVPMQIEQIPTRDKIVINRIRVGDDGIDTLDERIRKGELGAVLDTRDRLIPFLQEQTDTLARGVINEINRIHAAATGLEGYDRVRSRFEIPEGSTDPDTNQTLDTLFNNPRLPNDAPLVDVPFPVENGQMTIRVGDEDQETRDLYNVNVQTDDTLEEMVSRIDRADGIVNTARSALSFDPVFVEDMLSEGSIDEAEAANTLDALTVAAGTPMAESPGAYSFDMLIRNAGGGLIDSDPTTPTIDPFSVAIDNTMTLNDMATAIQNAGNGLIRANVAPDADDPTRLRLSIQAIEDGGTFSFQNDSSGIIEAFDFPVTDPSIPLIGGTATRAAGEFSGRPEDPFLGAGIPAFSPAFPGPPPNVIREGTLELVVIDNNNIPTVNTLTIQAGVLESMDDLEAAIEALDPNLQVEITADNEFIINATNNREFFFQNDTTGLVEAIGFDDISGHGDLFGQPFTNGSFEIVVANEQGTVTHIVEVPVTADPSTVGGMPSLNGIIDQINSAVGQANAPVRASIVTNPRNPDQNQVQIQSTGDFEFTFRSDDTLLLSALGFQSGPVLDPTGDPPIEGAEFPTTLGDNIGGLVRAEIINDNQIEIRSGGNDVISFVDDSSGFLAATGINALFFGTDAETMRINEEILDNINLLATSSDGNAGNNGAALEMAALEDERVLNDRTLGEFYRSMVSVTALEGSRARQFLQTNETIYQELTRLQEQNTGVSLDEESINIIRYQQAFQASARILTTIDNLLDIVINQIGA